MKLRELKNRWKSETPKFWKKVQKISIAAGVLGGAILASPVALPVAVVTGAVPNTVNIIAGAGLSGGGALTGNVTLILANSSTTLGNATLTLGSTTSAVGNLTLNNANVTSVASTFPNSYLANSSATIGNTSVTLGGTTTSLGNVTLTNATTNGLTKALVTKTANYTATIVDCTILGNASAGNITITLPTAASVAGRFYVVKKVDSSANTVTVATTSAQTIDGQSTKVLSIQYDGLQVQSDNANWVIISNTFGRNGTAGSF